MPTINMLSSATKVKGQGVSSAYIEQVNLVTKGLNDYDVKINAFRSCDINHYHTIDHIPLSKSGGVSVAYVHFIPETVDDSLKLPTIVKGIFYKYIIWFYKSVDHLVVVNPYFIDILTEKYHIDRSKITYIPNYVSEENFFKQDENTIINTRDKYDISSDSFVVLGVGQVQSRKGVLDFVQVAQNLPHVQFVWAGGFSFGAITDGYKELKKVIENPPSNVKFIGIVEREEMNDIYNIADVMFLPSFSELFPMAILESLALKIPVLLRDIDIYENILFNYYLKGKNISDFVDIITKLTPKDSEYKKWCEKSWKCHEFYSKEYVLNMWKQFYDRIYSKNRKLKFKSPSRLKSRIKFRRQINAKQDT